MVFGIFPFDGNSDEEIMKKINNGEYSFPNSIEISKTCKTIITKLLDKKPKQRLDLYDDLFDIWYEENSPDIVIKKQIDEEPKKLSKTLQKNYPSNSSGMKEKLDKSQFKSSSTLKTSDPDKRDSIIHKNVSNFRIEPRSENSKNRNSNSYINSILIKNKLELKKSDKKK